MDLSKYLTGLIIGVLLSLLFKGCGNQPNGGGNTTTVKHTTDTLYLPSLVVHDTAFVPTPVYIARPGIRKTSTGELVPDRVYADLSKDSLVTLLAQHWYQDTIKVQKGVQVAFKGYSHGVIDSVRLKLIDRRPIMHIVDSTTITHTLPPKSHSLGIGAVVTSLGVAPGVQYTQGRVSVGVHYLVPTQPGLQGIQTSIHYSLGSW